MKALFLYVGHYGCSRADSLVYLGILPEGGAPLDLIKARYQYHPAPETVKYGRPLASLVDRKTGDEHTLFAAKQDGETSYLTLDLDTPGPFLSFFEHEDNDNLMKARVRVLPEHLV